MCLMKNDSYGDADVYYNSKYILASYVKKYYAPSDFVSSNF